MDFQFQVPEFKNDLEILTGPLRVFRLVCCFTSQSTAMVMSERSVHLTRLFPGQA